MSEADCARCFCNVCVYALCACFCEVNQHRSRDNKRVEVLFRSHEKNPFLNFGFQIEKTSVEEGCCEKCCLGDCCDEGSGLTTSSQIVSVTRGGFAESMGVQVGWGLEKVGEVDVHDLQISSV